MGLILWTGVLREEGHLDLDDTGGSPHDDVTAAASLGAASIGSQPQKLTRVPPHVSDGPAHTWISNFWPPELWKSISVVLSMLVGGAFL